MAVDFPRGHSTLNNMMSAGDDMSWPNGDIDYLTLNNMCTPDNITGPTGDTSSPGAQCQLTSPGAQKKITSPQVIIFHSQLVLLGSLGVQWEYTLPRRHSTLNNIMFTGDDMSERCCQSQLVILSSPGAQWEQTLLWGHSTLNNMTIFIANWWQWQLTSLGALYMEHIVSTACQGQVVILSSPGAQWVQTLSRGHSTVNNVMIFHGQLVILSYPRAQKSRLFHGAFNTEQYDVRWW